MIEWKYFKALNDKNKKVIIDTLNYQLKTLLDGDIVDSEDYDFIEHDIHLTICDMLKNQSK